MTIDSSTGVRYGDSAAGSAHNEVLNEFYLSRMIDVRNNSNVLLSYIEEVTDPSRISGRDVVFPIHNGRSHGTNSIHAGGDLPDAGSQGYDRHQFPWKVEYGRIKVGGVIMMASDDNIASWVSVVDQEMRGLEDDFARQKNRKLHNDGSGRVAEISATANSATQTLRLNTGIAGNTVTGMNPNYFMRVGKAYAVVDRANPNVIRDVQVVNSISGTDQVVFAASINATAGDWVVEFSSDGSAHAAAADLDNSGFQSEHMGIAGIFHDQNIDDGTGVDGATVYNNGASATSFQGIAVSGNEFNQCTLNTASSARPLTLKLLQTTISDAEKANNTRIQVGLCPFEVYNQLTELVYPDRRYTSEGTQEFKAGHKGCIEYNGIGFYKDRDCYPNRLYLVDPDQVARFVVRDLHWIDEDGAILHRLPNKDDFQATLRCADQLGTWSRQRAGALITDITT